MAHRTFTSGDGRSWEVWEGRPDTLEGLPAALCDGWLAFECGSDRRRLAPIPSEWSALSVEQLDALLGGAQALATTHRLLS